VGTAVSPLGAHAPKLCTDLLACLMFGERVPLPHHHLRFDLPASHLPMTTRAMEHANPLGDLRAEADRLLAQSFLETPDYTMLLATTERFIVVGRRGTGKSALFLMFTKYWSNDKHCSLIRWSPEEDQVLGLRPVFRHFGEAFTPIKAACKTATEAALLLDFLGALSAHYKFHKSPSADYVFSRLHAWKQSGQDTTERLRRTIQSHLADDQAPELQVANLGHALELQKLRDALHDALEATGQTCVLLVDRLDEGYQADTLGTAIIDGIIHAISSLKTRFPSLKPVLFVRDNIFRSVERDDPDFSRSIEGQYVRLHWDDQLLLALVAKRLRAAFSLSIDKDLRAWDHCVAPALQSLDGFRQCLALTLYRPRDLIALLNESFYHAHRHGRPSLELEDIKSTARQISSHRLDDLIKEYAQILPGLRHMVAAFSNGEPSLTMRRAFDIATHLRDTAPPDRAIQTELAIFGDPDNIIRLLYGIGFLGVRDKTTGRFVFCHDGRTPDRALVDEDEVLIHPCYWMALNLTRSALERDAAQEIYDEYSIEVSSEATDLRKKRLGQLVAQLDSISPGPDDARAFEEWCLSALRVLFASPLRNIVLHPNKSTPSRRDIVATNLAENGAWRRVLDDYGSRQVVFEVKNYDGHDRQDYSQVLSYLGGDYGNIGFIVCRDPDETLKKNSPSMDTMREMYRNHKKLIVRLSARSLRNNLSKLRSPTKNSVGDSYLNKILDAYQRLYLAGEGAL
jgi:hypothetical protein